MTSDIDASPDRARLIKGSRLHWVHWTVVGLSLTLTVGAWYFAKSQVDKQTSEQFKGQASQVVDLVLERMSKYEDALWAGAGTIHASGGSISYEAWHRYADSLHLERKYPGVNGFGVIHRVAPEQLEAFLEEQRRSRPDFRVFPVHDEAELLPITFIEPVASNAQAVGLDIAHETNRYTAALKARDTGLAQITGPIVLVQDSGGTPGFLFYVPFYRDDAHETLEQRRTHFAGLAYAPFVMNRLMEGVLAKHRRHVSLRIRDGSSVLYDEHLTTEQNFDPEPLLTKRVPVPLYGRQWNFEIQSAMSFRALVGSNQPYVILIGGIIIDAILLALFVLLSRANRQALQYADRATLELQRRSTRLERSNSDLEQFAYVASHDLQEPLRMVGNFTQLLQRRYAGQLDERADQYIEFAVDGVSRMQVLLNDLLEYSRVGAGEKQFETVAMGDICQAATVTLHRALEESGGTVEIATLPQVSGDPTQLHQLIQNLVANALKFRSPARPPSITIGVEDAGDDWRFHVSDNGIGIEAQYFDKIFVMFQRLHDRDQYEGTGVGLAICKKVVIRHGGQLWATSIPGLEATFYFTIPKLPSGKVAALPALDNPADGEAHLEFKQAS